MLDLDAYLERIGLSGRPGLDEVHRAHATSIPFENLDPHRGVPVSLSPEELERKLVLARRGGYCFEQNLLLANALQALGFDVDLMLARVRVGSAPHHRRPRSHLVLRVHADGSIWHADAGFGVGTLLDPIPFGPGVPHEQSGWHFRVIQDESELVLQTLEGEHWRDLYGLVPEPVPTIDLEVSNWYTCTNPRSPFVTGLTVCSHRSDGSRLLLNDWSELELAEQTPTEIRATLVAHEDVPRILSERFGLPGFALGDDRRLVLAKDG